jgi:hypothetical protein
MRRGVRKGAAAACLLILVAAGCGTASTKTNEVALVYTGGVIEDAKFERCMEGGANNNRIGQGSTAYVYRTDQRTFIGGDTDAGADTPEVTVVSKDNIRLSVPYQLYFKLNYDCGGEDGGILRKFHDNLGVKTEAWVGGGDDSNNPDAGWDKMLNEYFRPQIERSLERGALQYDWKALYSSEEARKGMQDVTVGFLRDAIIEVIGAQYFCGPSYNGPGTDCGPFTMTIGKPAPVDDKVIAGLEAVEANRGQVDAQAQENARKDKELEAVSRQIDKLGPGNYVLLEGIRSGKISVMVVPPGTNVQVPSPR